MTNAVLVANLRKKKRNAANSTGGQSKPQHQITALRRLSMTPNQERPDMHPNKKNDGGGGGCGLAACSSSSSSACSLQLAARPKAKSAKCEIPGVWQAAWSSKRQVGG
jgi:hypothetical protein